MRPSEKQTSSLQGKPLQVVKLKNNHTFTLDESLLSSVLNDPKVKNKKVVVVSVAGAFRRGKSFLLDFFLRFLSQEGSDDWLHDEKEPLQGFSWRTGIERDTTGIWLWSHPFIRKSANGEEIAILLMDTQGTFDSSSTVRENATVFGLSTLLSSIQIYNVIHSIKEDDLQHLQLFTEYGRLAASGEFEADPNVKPFQRLMVLVRDWSFTQDFPLGFQGGKDYLQKILKISTNQHEDLKGVRQHINTSFESVDCFLLPHPGFEVVENPNYDGSLSDVRKTFKDMLPSLVKITFAPNSIIPKKVNGVEITCRDLFNYFVSYVKLYSREDLPVPKTALMATAEANNISAKDVAFYEYEQRMEELSSGPHLYPKEFEKKDRDYREHAVQTFQKIKKLGGKSYSDSFQKDLLLQIDRASMHFRKINDAKGSLARLKTPLTFVVLYLFTYLLSYRWVGEVLEALRFGFLRLPFEIMFWFVTFTILTYTVIRASGIQTGFLLLLVQYIDKFSEWIWDKTFVTCAGALPGNSAAVSKISQFIPKKIKAENQK